MSDQEQALESAAAPEVQAKAEKMGWIPPARFKGDPTKFTDAEEFLRRGEEVLPIVKKQLADVRAENDQLRVAQAETAAALKTAQAAIEQIEERHTVETKRAVIEARAELKRQLASASEAGDHEAIADLTDKMTQLNVADDKAEPPKKNGADAPTFKPDPAVTEWNRENPWFGREGDEDKTAFALGYGQKLRKQGDASQGRAFFDKLSAEVERVFEGKKDSDEPPAGKVESGRSGGGEPQRGGKRKTFASLPVEAKDACEADVRSKVGPGKRYKTADEWRSRYAELYYGQES